MFEYLQIADPGERRLAAVADAALAVAAAPGRWLRRRAAAPGSPRRILLLRLERIGDLLMTLDAIAEVRRLAPLAEIDLVVGRWNEPLARLIPHVTRVETLDAAWLARAGDDVGSSALWRRAYEWRARRYDLAINLEADVRSNLLPWIAGAARRAGFDMAGGGPLLTTRAAYDPRAHVSDNTMRLVRQAFGATGLPTSGIAEAAPGRSRPALDLPEKIREAVAAEMRSLPRPLVGIHSSCARPIKQWDPAKLGELAARLYRARGGSLVLLGAAGDRDAMRIVQAAAPAGAPVRNLVGVQNLIELAATLELLDVFVTGDTGPMHVAAAMRTPIVAIFGPSDPARYGPRGSPARIVRIDLPCSPCNRIRRPPERCVGHEPDCLRGIGVERVLDEALQLLTVDNRAHGGRQ